MKKFINRNILWAELFVDQLARCGVKHVCISPGSRSTPLTFAFAQNNKIKKFVIIDERSSAFFALGLAKSTNTPVAVVTTSGTATAELYSAIVEAYQQRAPLIICTGDRPPELYNTGANQTINQIDIYKNHIRKFYNAGLPSISKKKLLLIKKIAAEIFDVSLNKNRGPVHINFPFNKPFEPDSFTDKIDENFLKEIRSINFYKKAENKNFQIKIFEKICGQINKTAKGIIICGPGEYEKSFHNLLNKFSEKIKFPVFADASSSARFTNNKNVITNYDSFFRSEKFVNNFDPQLILQFGAAPTTKHSLEFFEKSKAEKILINEFGDLLDPSKTSSIILKAKPETFLSKFLRKNILSKRESAYLNSIKIINNWINDFRENKIEKAQFPFDGKIISEILSVIPSGSNLFISNSMPVRDLDCFAGASNKNIKVFSNRGASGIDGITSTALGIAASSKKKTILITGDLAFYHDLNGLLAAKNYSIPLIIILINNNGGSIFEMLPVSKHKNIFNRYFKTPHQLDFKKFVEGYAGNFVNIKNWNSLKTEFAKALKQKNFSVLHFKTDSAKSHLIRKAFWKEAVNITNNIINDN